MVAQETVVANVSHGYCETQNYGAFLQVVSHKFGAEMHAFMMSVFDHKLNQSFLCM